MVKGIYKITNDRTGEVYIGQSVNIERRKSQHLEELENGTHHNRGMQKDHNLGDTFSFEILEEIHGTRQDLHEREKAYIDYYNSFDAGYNQTPGGEYDKFKGRYKYGGGRKIVQTEMNSYSTNQYNYNNHNNKPYTHFNDPNFKPDWSCLPKYYDDPNFKPKNKNYQQNNIKSSSSNNDSSSVPCVIGLISAVVIYAITLDALGPLGLFLGIFSGIIISILIDNSSNNSNKSKEIKKAKSNVKKPIYKGQWIICPKCKHRLSKSFNECPYCHQKFDKNKDNISSDTSNSTLNNNNLKTKTHSIPVKQSSKLKKKTKESKKVVSPNTENKSLLKRQFYYKMDNGYRISKTKVISMVLFFLIIFVFVFFTLDGSDLYSSILIAILCGLIFTFPIFIFGMGIHYLLERDSREKESFKHYLFYYYGEETRLSKTKTIFWIVFFIFGLIVSIGCLNEYNFDVFNSIMYFLTGGLLFGIPTFIAGYSLHYLLTGNE